MEISPRKHSKRTLEPVDEWLQNEGYFRKHTPKDPTCLFRAISEQIYSTQYYHIRVRKECVEYMRKMKHLFEEYITIPYECYLEQMACFTEWGGINEIQVMSLLYKREIVLFNGQKQTRKLITNNGFKDTIYLCHIPQRQYESVYTKDFITTAGFCQSTVYQILYKDVFGMSNVDGTVHKMLHDRNTALRHDKFFLKGNVEIRDQLVAEIYSKVENNSEEDDGTQSASKNAPPFPYRVAKALDPNIYRNIDFDIWHEIRREVKNAGWTRYNSNELQVGGKCLIQMDFSNEEFDKINSNSSIMHIVDEIQNDNEIKTLQIKENQDPTFFCGHIQEMSKNEGPVLVFIEELGEKRTVPYSSLKPLPLRKNKPTNWLPLCKKNIQLSDTNQKWKKTYNGNLRKVKEPVNSNTVSNNNDNNSSDNNNNNNDNDITTGVNYNNNDKNNSVNSIKQDNSEINQWHRAPSKRDQRQTFGNYVGDKVSNYNINNTNSLAPAKENVQQDMKTDSNENSSENDGICKTPAIPISSMSNKNNIHNFSHSKQKLQKETFCTHYPGNMQVMPSAPTLFYVAPDGNTYPIISPIPSNLVDTIPNNQMDRTLRCINSSALKSNDANGSDLPLSDPLTLRFFYNLGLEYYRISHAWNFGTNGQTIPFGQWHHDIPQYKEEVGNIPSEMQSNCTIVQQNGETNDNDVPESTVQQVDTKMVNVSPKGMQDSVPNYSQKNEGKNSLHLGREKVKDQIVNNRDTPRMNRNGLAPRFKKNPDRSHNNSHQAHVQQNCSNQYQSNVTKPGPSNISDLRKDGAQVHYTNAIPHQAYTPPPISNSCQPSYIQQPMYSGMPFCTNDSEAFTPPYYVPNGAFFPISCMPHSDLSDGNSVNLYSPHFYSGAETYAQTYPAVCAPFMYSQHAPYPGVPQNMHDQWFTIPGQPHYMQYTPIPVSATESCNGVTQNTNLNSSP